ncbi:hypothetical protein [Candidatus Arthromitus sp. SFB-rat-Yit]|uniref:hypothetical protein n=1 Tax=Candidatus Arthromitus sp. SFB-rat-Yit TaxID=1041504 RepID=UPI0002DFE863|nr:hypothetical protein [Candidatus Arthromitus sp. SFB-rat-Yit]
MYTKKNLFRFISILLFLIFFSICCFITYLIIKKEHSHKYKLDSYISSLNNTYKLLDNNLDSEKNITKSLENINTLQISKRNLNTSLKLNEMEMFNSLLHSSELYIKQLQNLKNNKNNVNENITSLKNYFDGILISLKSLPANSNLLKETIETITNIQNTYENSFYTEKINSISNLNLNNFINKLNSIMYDFLPLIENIEEKLIEARENKYDYQLIINNLEKNLAISENLKLSLSKLPIPQDGLNLYHQMEEILEIYNEYNIKLKYCIKNENLLQKEKLDKDTLNKIYQQTDSIYSKLLNQYNTLKHKIDSKLNIPTYIYN